MKTVYHPNLAETSYEVEDDAVEAWVEQGWKKSEPKASKDAREARAAAFGTPGEPAPPAESA